MKLSDITKGSEAIIVGRFQPFTDGHLAMYKFAKSRFPVVHVGVSERKSPRFDVSNPFKWKDRADWARKATGAKVYKAFGLNPDTLEDQVGKPVVMVVGKDQEQAIKNWQRSRPDMQYLIVPRSDEDISATKVRQALVENDEKKFRSMMPSGLHGEFSKMRKILLGYL